MSRFRTPFDAIEDPTGFDPPIYPQAQVDPVDFDIIDQATAGEGVLSGCAVTASSPEALTVDVAVGQVILDGIIYDVDVTPDLAIVTPNATQPRFDLVCADDSGTPFVVDGLPAEASPLFPSGASVMGTSVVLASIYVPASLAEVTADHLTDKRAHVGLPPAGSADWTPVRATADLVRNNTAALAADTVLKFALAASTKYMVRGHVVISTLAASDGRYGFLGPASPTYLNVRDNAFRPLSTTPIDRVVSAYDTTGQLISTTSATEWAIGFDIVIHNGSNTGDFSFAWGQGQAVAENTTRRAGSFLEYVAL